MCDFLSLDDALYIHKRQLDRFGGGDGMRDEGLLLSALEMPQSGFEDKYFHGFPYEMAAAYLFHIVKNHPFVDGNKRTGFACAHAFLKLNGYNLEVSSEQVIDLVLQVATGQLTKDNVSAMLQSWSVPYDE